MRRFLLILLCFGLLILLFSGCGTNQGTVSREEGGGVAFTPYPPMPETSEQLEVSSEQKYNTPPSVKDSANLLLPAGWSTISFPFNSLTYAQGFSYQLQYWDGSSYQKCDPGNAAQINCRMGFWAYTPNPAAIVADGEPPDVKVSVNLSSGWNLVAFPYQGPKPLSYLTITDSSGKCKILPEVATQATVPEATTWIYGLIQHYKNNHWYSLKTGDYTAALQPWQGYWIYSWKDGLRLDFNQPQVTWISPQSGVPAETLVTVTGFNFGSATGQISFNGVNTGAIKSWSDTRISCVVPKGIITGPVVVSVNRQTSNNNIQFKATLWGLRSQGLYAGTVNRLALGAGNRLIAGTYGAGILRSENNGADWQLINSGLSVPASLFVNSLASDAAGRLYTIADALYRSTDNGNSWQKISFAINTVTASTSIAFNAAGHIFFSYRGNGVYRSTDNGSNWTRVFNTTDDGFLAVNPAGTIFFAVSGKGVYRSPDNGISWTLLNSGLTDTSFQCLRINSKGIIFVATWNAGVFRSIDNGDNWSQVVNGLTSYTVPSLALDSHGNLYAGTWGGGVCKSPDNGDNWEYAGLANTAVRSLVVNTNDNLFAGSDGEGIFRSGDQGVNWEATNEGFANAWVRDLAISSADLLVAATWNAGVFISSNRGENWVNKGLNKIIFDSAIFTPGGRILIGCGDILSSDDNGDSWSQKTFGLSNLVQGFAVNRSNGHIFAATQNGIWRSTDNGDNWTQTSNGLTGTNFYPLGINSQGQLFTGLWSGNGEFFTSTDNGENWSKILNFNKGIRSIAVNSSDQLFVGTGQGLLRSSDNGASWVTLSLPAYTDVYTLLIDSQDRIYVGSLGKGVYVSRDNGATWTQINDGLFNPQVLALVEDSTGYLYAATYGGVFKTGKPAP